jgi:branched-chain amino acid transport system substrate-binding protein
VGKTPLVGGQWVKGKKTKYEMLIVNNETATQVSKQAAVKAIPY